MSKEAPSLGNLKTAGLRTIRPLARSCSTAAEEEVSLKTLLVGAVAALAGGLVLGDELRPDLWAGPQDMEPAYGDLSEGGFLPIGWTRPGPAPDYVVGTDWLPKPYIYEDEPLEVNDPDTEPTFAALAHEPPATPPAFDTTPPQPSYPSMGGGVLIQAAAAPDPAPVEPPDA